MPMRILSTPRIQYVRRAVAPHQRARRELSGPEDTLQTAMAKQAAAPRQQRFLISCSVGRSERRADWIRRARKNRSGLNAHEDSEHSPDSICASRSSPSLKSAEGAEWSGALQAAMAKQAAAPRQQRFLNSCSVGRSERRADWIRRARKNRSGLNAHEDSEHSPDSICASRSSPSPKSAEGPEWA